MTWFQFFLFLHILAAIAVFGPSFAFPIIGSFAAKQPQHALLVTEISEAIEKRIVIPGATVMPFLGLILIYLGHFQLWKSEWLVIGIALYIVAYFFAVLVQNRSVERLIQALKSAPPPPPDAPPAGGPPPAIAAMVRRVQMGGMFLTLLIVAITILMVWRPGSCQGIC
jgi:uncharacterized membrane protein